LLFVPLAESLPIFHNDVIIKGQNLYNAQGHNPEPKSLTSVQLFQIEKESIEKLKKDKTDKRRYKNGKYIFINILFFK